jgi:hypothetical protein
MHFFASLVSITLLLLALGLVADTLFSNADKVLTALGVPALLLKQHDRAPMTGVRPRVVSCSHAQRPANSNSTAVRSLPLAA